jgi:hydroxypyruvate reductase
VDKPLRQKLWAIGEQVLLGLSPSRCLSRTIRREGHVLKADPVSLDLSAFRRVVAVGFGKASAGMAQALEEILGDRLERGAVIVPPGYGACPKVIRVLEAGHPLPDDRTLSASQEILAEVGSLGPADLLLVLVSGGGSALFEIPAPGLTLADLRRTTALLLRCGATIGEINVVRKHLSQVKGGGLLQHTQAGVILTLVLSDVPGDDPSLVASGPTVPDPSTFAMARAVLELYRVWETVPKPVREHLQGGERGEFPETRKPGDPLFARVHTVVVGSGRVGAELAASVAEKLGFHVQILTTTLRGEAREAGRMLAALAEEELGHERPLPLPALFVLSGETTVTVRGAGLGGRNQELALSFALEVAGKAGVALLSLATDGRDGPTDAAGALVDGGTAERARKGGLEPRRALATHDSYRALLVSGDLLRLGPTGTNVADLVLLGVERGSR